MRQDHAAAPDAFDLDRFVRAQEPVIDRVRRELAAGRKTSHWMWFVFPQLAGLGRSPMARRFAIASLDEARAYLRHPTLGPRLVECARLVAATRGRSALEIFGNPDDLKFHSSMSLFHAADPGIAVFREALDRYFGTPDPATTGRLALLAPEDRNPAPDGSLTSAPRRR